VSIESALPVSEWRIDGLRVWPLIRLTLYANWFDAAVPEASIAASRGRNAMAAVRVLSAWAKAVVKDASRNIAPTRRCDALFLAYSAGTQPLIDGWRVNRLLAPYVSLLDEAGYTTSVWEMSPYSDYNLPRFTPSFLVQPWLLFWRTVTLRDTRARDERLDGYEDFLECARSFTRPFRYSDIGSLRRDARFIRRAADGFKRWIARAKPKLGIIADYGPREQAFCLACRELSVSTVDIQHGVQGEMHPAYGRWNDVPAGGFETRPTYYWNWDEKSAGAINRWTYRFDATPRAVVGGNAFADQWRDSESELFKRFARALDAELAKAGGSKHVIVSLDSIGDILPPAIRGALAAAPKDWCFWLRLHPVNQQNQRRALATVLRTLNCRVLNWEFTSASPLTPLLYRADVHLSVNWSSVIDEAAEAGLRSVAAANHAAELYPDHVTSGVLRVVETSEDILTALRAQMREAPAARQLATTRAADAMRWLMSRHAASSDE
jgi:hypothetical protein